MIEHVATRPDFISYKYSDFSNLFLCLCKLMGAKTAAWTLRSEDNYALAKDHFDFFMFDRFPLNG